MISALKKYLPSISFAEPEGGFFVSITLPEQTDCLNLPTRAQEAGLVLTDGRGFFADPLNESQNIQHLSQHFVRLPFCALTPAQIEEGVRRLAMLS